MGVDMLKHFKNKCLVSMVLSSSLLCAFNSVPILLDFKVISSIYIKFKIFLF